MLLVGVFLCLFASVCPHIVPCEGIPGLVQLGRLSQALGSPLSKQLCTLLVRPPREGEAAPGLSYSQQWEAQAQAWACRTPARAQFKPPRESSVSGRQARPGSAASPLALLALPCFLVSLTFLPNDLSKADVSTSDEV